MGRIAGKARRGAGRWVALVSLTFVVALGLALLILALYRPSQRSLEGGQSAHVELPASLAGGVTARQAYPAAVDVARSWQPDGQLAIISAHWRPRQERWPSDVAWIFQFYSPAARRLAVVVVDGGRARLLRETLTPYPLSTFGEGDWQVDSLPALDTWWNAGGATFRHIHSEVDLMAQLRVLRGEDDRLVWIVTGIAGDQVRKLVVDGTTGEQVQD